MSVERDPTYGCLIWTGKLDRDGYGYCGDSRAHIVAWVRERGAVPDGLELDHICRRRACCAVHHLEAVSRTENERRKRYAYRMRMKECAAGHPYRVHAIMVPTGGRVCRQCNRDALVADRR